MKRAFFFFVAVAIALGGSMQRADAGSIAAFTGSSVLSVPGPVDGTVNYAVYDSATSSFAGDVFGTGKGGGFDGSFVAGTGSGALDTGARYLYVYQTVNNGGDSLEISANTVQIVPANLTSWGWFTVGGGAQAPFSVAKTTSSLEADYTPPATGLAAGSSSFFWGYTSNIAPVFGRTGFQDGGSVAQGIAPQAAPEPASVVMLGIGISGMFGYGLRRRKVALAA